VIGLGVIGMGRVIELNSLTRRDEITGWSRRNGLNSVDRLDRVIGLS
jgi:hypothetical protein